VGAAKPTRKGEQKQDSYEAEYKSSQVVYRYRMVYYTVHGFELVFRYTKVRLINLRLAVRTSG
jgi:hypothetical protein